jgi:hypothetical protein
MWLKIGPKAFNLNNAHSLSVDSGDLDIDGMSDDTWDRIILGPNAEESFEKIMNALHNGVAFYELEIEE